jgi:RecB family exonuclease
VAWIGPFQPALEERWLDTLARLPGREALGPVWLLAPSRVLGRHLVRLAAGRGAGANLSAMTFTDLADRILAGADRPGRAFRRLPPTGDALVLRHAVEEAVAADGYFGAVRDAPRFPAALATTFAELRTAGVGPRDLARAAQAATGASAVKLAELGQVLEHVESTLDRSGFRHPTDALWAAAARLTAGPALPEPRALCTYGFTEWNAAERAVLGAAAARMPVTCLVPAVGDPPFELIAELIEWLEGQGFHVDRLDVPATDGPRALAARLFREPATAAAAPAAAAAIEVVAAPGEEREMREIARRVLEAADGGLAFDQVGVLLRRPEAYRQAVRDVFGEAGIPHTWGAAPRLGETRAGRSLRLLLAARREDFARTAVIELLATAPLRQGGDAEPAEWDRLSREAGIVGGAADWRRGRARLLWRARAAPAELPGEPGAAARPADPAADPVVDTLGRVVRRLCRSLEALPARAPVADLARALLRAFVRLCRRDAGTERIETLLGGLQGLAAIPTALDLLEFGQVLDAALEAPAETGPEDLTGRVFVGPLGPGLGLPFRLVFIPGLAEQGFPGAPRADPILTEAERKLLHRLASPAGRPGLGLLHRRPAEERVAFRLAVAAAAERLVLTYPRVDPQSGRDRVPSFFLLRVAEAATGRAFDFTRLERDLPWHVRVPLVPAPPGAVERPIDRREWLLAQATRARLAGPAGHAACLALMPRAACGREALLAREQADHLTPWDGLLPAATLPALRAWHRPLDAPVAATPLETYAACPFRYYLAQVLHVTPAVEPERATTLQPADRGLLLHTVLARAYALFQDAGLLPLTPDRLPRARPLLDAAFTGAEPRFATGLEPLWRGERARLYADLQAMLDAEARAGGTGAPWVPTLFETGFGAGGAEPDVAHALADGRTVRLRGRLDRLDVSPDGARARVVDYKSGASPPGRGAALRHGTALQLPVYRLGAEALCRARGLDARVEEAQYHFLTRRGGRRRLSFTAADWQARRDDFDRVLATVLDGIAAGRFFQSPSPETCRSCDYQPICGTERERIAWAERKLADPARAAHARLLEVE